MRATTATALSLALAACAAPKEGARDSVDTLPATPPAIVGETARVTAEPMPSAAPRDSAAPMPAARGAGGAAPMPNATTPAPAKTPEQTPEKAPAPRESTTKRPPIRVIPDPVLPHPNLPPRDSTARRP